MTVFYFTSTGNCLAVAKCIGGTLISIPQVVDYSDLHFKDDAIGIVFPIYGFKTPKMVGRFLDTVKITDVGVSVSFGEKCEGCFACTHLCPQNAIHLKGQRSGKRWRNPDVSLSEIIQSNNRRQTERQA